MTAPADTLLDLSLRAAAGPENAFAGRYQVTRVLKEGGDSETLLARDLKTGADVVIKTAASESFSPAARMRLEHEARILTQMRSGRTTPLLEHGAAGSHVFLVMPLIPGVSLQDRLRH